MTTFKTLSQVHHKAGGARGQAGEGWGEEIDEEEEEEGELGAKNEGTSGGGDRTAIVTPARISNFKLP